MSCLCQYLNTTTEAGQKMHIYPVTSNDDTEDNPEANSDDSKVVKILDASDLARTCAENWLLKKKLFEYEVTIESLEQLVTTIVDKQHEILGEMFRLQAENSELKTECHQQREYHTMERNALIKELYDIQTFYSQKIQLAFEQKKQKEQEQSVKDEESEDESESNEESSIASSDDDPSETDSIASTASTSPCSTDSENESSETEEESSLTESESD